MYVIIFYNSLPKDRLIIYSGKLDKVKTNELNVQNVCSVWLEYLHSTLTLVDLLIWMIIMKLEMTKSDVCNVMGSPIAQIVMIFKFLFEIFLIVIFCSN